MFELKLTDKYVGNYRFLDLGIKELIKEKLTFDKKPKENYFIVSFLNEDGSLWGEDTVEGLTGYFYRNVNDLINKGFILLRGSLNRKDWKDDDLNEDIEHNKLVYDKRIEFWNYGLFERYGYPKYVEIKLSDSKGSQQ